MDLKVYKREINTLQAMIYNSKIPFIVYEDKDEAICTMPEELLYEDGSVRCQNKLLLWDEEEEHVICEGVKEVYCELKDILVIDEMNASKEQLNQVKRWFKKLGMEE